MMQAYVSSDSSDISSDQENSYSSPVENHNIQNSGLQINANNYYSFDLPAKFSSTADVFEISDEDEEQEQEGYNNPIGNLILKKKKNRTSTVFHPFSSFSELEITVESLNDFLSKTDSRKQYSDPIEHVY